MGGGGFGLPTLKCSPVSMRFQRTPLKHGQNQLDGAFLFESNEVISRPLSGIGTASATDLTGIRNQVLTVANDDLASGPQGEES